MALDRNHAFADGLAYGPATSWLDRWMASQSIGPYAPAPMRAHHAWQHFRRIAGIDPTCRLGPNAWCINHTGDLSRIALAERVVCRGLLRIEKFGAGRIVVGADSYIGDDCLLSSAAGITIGAQVLIAHEVQIFDNDSHPLDAAARVADYSAVRSEAVRETIASAPISIGDRAWIGFRSIITKGVSIGENAVIATGSTVTRDVPANVVVAGNPAVVVKELAA